MKARQRILNISPRFAARVAKDRHARRGSAAFNWFAFRVEVAYRTSGHHVILTDKQSGAHLASFTDNGPGCVEVDYLTTGVVVRDTRQPGLLEKGPQQARAT